MKQEAHTNFPLTCIPKNCFDLFAFSFCQQHQQLYYSQDDAQRKNFDAYRLYLQSPHRYEDAYFDDRVHFPASTDYSTQYGLKSTTNYVDFYSTKRPSYRAEQYPGSPDSWV